MASPVAAQVAGAGSKQITFAGGGVMGEDYQSLNATIGLTQYFTDRFELGGFLSGNANKSGDDDVQYSGYLFANATFNLVTQSMTVPFVFGGVGTPLDEDRQGDLSFNVGAGFKRFVNENFSFNGQASAIGNTVEDMEGNETVEWGDFILLNFGFSYYIR
jgi:hypothetical protein